MLTWGHVLVSAGGCVAAFSYLLTFQSTAGRTWCILISLNCCVSHATGGLADGYKVIYTGCVFSVVELTSAKWRVAPWQVQTHIVKGCGFGMCRQLARGSLAA